MLKALLTIGAVQVVTMLVMLIRTKTLAVLLGPEYVGAMAVIDKLLAVIAQTASLSMPFAAVRFLPERWTAGPAEFRALFTRMRNLLLTLILLATTIALLVCVFRPSLWGNRLLPYRDALTIAILGLPVIALVPFLQNAVAGRLQQNRSMLVGFLNAVVLAAAAAGVFWHGLVGYYAVYAVLGAVLVAVITHQATRGTVRVPSTTGPQKPSVFGLPAQIWRFSGALLILTFLSPYAALFVHYRLLSDHGARTAGWMQAAVGIGLSVRAVLGTAHAVFLTPNVNRGGVPAHRMEWANNFQMMFCLLAGLAVPPLLLFPSIAVRLLYSPAFLPGATFVMVFVLVEVVTLLSGTYSALVVAFDRMTFHVVTNLLAQLLVVFAASRLVGPLGILGAGLAALVAPVFLLVATMSFLHKAYALRVPPHVAARSGWLLAGLVASGLVGALYEGPLWQALLLKVGTYLVIAGGFALLLTDDERQRTRALLRGWGAATRALRGA
jgi:antigen flippase